MPHLGRLLVLALVVGAAVEALDVAVLHGPTSLDQAVVDALALRRGDERAACDRRSVVGVRNPTAAHNRVDSVPACTPNARCRAAILGCCCPPKRQTA